MINTNMTINQTRLQATYYRYKRYVIPVIVLVVCVFLFLEVNIPQLQNFLAIRQEVQTNQAKLDALRANLYQVSKINDQDLDTSLKLASTALPSNKDFFTMINALSNAAINSGVSLGDYSLQVGDLSGNDAANNTLNIKVTVSGDINNIKNFIIEAKKQLPLIDVSDLKLTNNTTNMTLVFFYKPFSHTAFDDSKIIQPISSQEQNLLNRLNTSFEQAPPTIQTASSSAGSSAGF